MKNNTNQQKQFQESFWDKEHDNRLENKHIFVLENLLGKKYLDIGCGNGKILKEIKKRGFYCEGIDISEKSKKICSQYGIKIITLDISSKKTNYEDNSFDVVILTDVLEHLFEPEKVLREACRISAKYVIITTPNFNSLSQRIEVMLGRVPTANSQRKGHCFWFNKKKIEEMVKNCGVMIKKKGSSQYFKNNIILSPIFRVLEIMAPGLFSTSFNLVLVKK